MSEAGRVFAAADGPKTPRRSPLFGALKGTFTMEPGHDLAAPSLDPAEWQAALDAKLAKFDALDGNK